MRRFLGRALAVLGMAAATALVLHAGEVRIATYNLENYVATDRLVDGVFHRDYPKPEAAKTALRAVVRSLDADLLAVQEIGPQPYLKELQRDLRREGCDYAHTILLEAGDPDRHVALLSRRAFTAVHRHDDLHFPYFGAEETAKRGLLEASIAAPGGDVTVFVVHLKSRYTDRSDDPLSALRRAGEAEAIRDRILERFPDPARARFVVLGDFNDTPGSRPLRALSRRGRTAIAAVLPAADSRGETWTHCFRKEDAYARVDYVLVSPGLRGAVAGGRAVVADIPETRAASDHRPVLVTLRLGEP